jgi:RimJ/RimL family protein N-acetyltransferase
MWKTGCMRLALPKSIIRSFDLSDASAIVKHASSRAWGNFKDTFPSGLSIKDAEAVLRKIIAAEPETWFAIEVDSEVIGACHITILPPPEQQPAPTSGVPCWFNKTYPGKATVGYWLDEAHRGRGIVDEAFHAPSRYMAREHNVLRMLSFRIGTDQGRVEYCPAH